MSKFVYNHISSLDEGISTMYYGAKFDYVEINSVSTWLPYAALSGTYNTVQSIIQNEFKDFSGAAEYTNCISEEGQDFPQRVS